MTLPLPRCALCGKSLARQDRLTVETSLPGSPRVSWHEFTCAWHDPLVNGFISHSSDKGALLRKVLKRGQDRVRAGKLFWQSRKAVR